MVNYINVLKDVFPGFKHHRFVHTPLFGIISRSIIYLLTRSKIAFIICFANLFFHLVLDTIGTTAPILWFYPVSTNGITIGSVITSTSLTVIKWILFIIPVVYFIYNSSGLFYL